ncbi:hypothetical protein H2508_04685 [Parahaliea sp. F7430]|uniref:Uncharacterized protein n=1 Tax=Sediminihaliea albiluteola TaxID=2758564 RepID=A0A7W2YIR7_9GAMM|nr:hypothetical protein [Sediminihaliea albiluteola]MBA6412400.1 hypothetical protein [Sediminihaliea albiluteola]
MSKAQRRYRRTIILGVLALAALVWAAVEQFGIPLETMLELALGSAIAVVMVIVAAGLVVSVWQLLRWLLRRRQ